MDSSIHFRWKWKEKRKSIYGKTKDEVHKKLTEIQYNHHNGNFIQKHGISLIRVLEQNREDKYAANLISDSHYARLEFVLKEIASSDIGQTDITQITRRDLQNYFNSLITRYTDSSIKKIWEQVKQAFQTSLKEKYILENPFEDVLKPKSRKQTKIVEALTTEEQEKLTNYLLKSNITDEKYRNTILIQLYTGMRIGEVLALTLDDLDFENKLIKVNKTISVDKNGNLTLSNHTKTYSGMREIPMYSFVPTLLMEQLNEYTENKNNLIFTYEKRFIKASSVNTVLKRICKQLNLSDKISTHSLRHTFGTRCIESGMNPAVVQRLMGHKDISITLNTYTSVFNKYKQKELLKAEKYYLENNFFKELPDTTIKLDEKNYTINETDENNIGNEDYFLREDSEEYSA